MSEQVDGNISARSADTKRSFGHSSAVLWNSLPTQAKQIESISTFNNLIK